MSKAILVSGEPVYCEADVRSWHEHGLTFPALSKRTETRAVVLHWTGGEGGGLDGGQQENRVIRERRLSVHFCIEQDGTVYQYVDAGMRCAHASGANDWSVGIEVANRANGKPNEEWPREKYFEVVHGKRFACSRFYPAQVAAAQALCSALCRAYGLPLDVPKDEAGALIAATLAPASLAEYRGVLGHYHIKETKRDPGTELLRAIKPQGRDVIA